MLKLLFADQSGRVYEHPELLAPPGLDEPVPLPAHATLSVLPGRRPLGFDATGATVELRGVQAVAAVLPPGWTRSELPAYRKGAIAPILPQWAYTAAAWDTERR